MNANTILNTLILSLSLATLFLTILSFFVFKIRQVSRSLATNKRKLESTYFIMYQPIKTSKDLETEITTKPPNPFVTAGSVLLLSSLLIAASLYIGQIISPETELEKRAKKAKTAKILFEKGLLKTTSLNSSLPNPTLQEFITENQNKILSQKMIDLGKYKILLLRSNPKMTNVKLNQLEALRRWEALFTKYNIPFKTTTLARFSSTKHETKEVDIVIAPQFSQLSNLEIRSLQSKIERNIPFFFSGALGFYNELGEPKDQNKIADLFSLLFRPSQLLHIQTSRAVFSGDTIPFSQAPPGLNLAWSQLDQGLLAFSFKEHSAILASSTGTSLIKDEVHHQYQIMSKAIYHSNTPMFWTQFDPPNDLDTSIDRSESFYKIDFLISSLLWLAKHPIAKVSNWPAPHNSSLVLSIDVDQNLSDLEPLLKKINSRSTSPTLFFNSALFNVNEIVLHGHYESASLVNSAPSLYNQNIYTQFDRLQKSALLTEENLLLPVTGVHPPKEEFDETTLNALFQQQSRFKYVFTTSQFRRLSPLFINNQKFILFPRTLPNDLDLYYNPTIGTIDEFTQNIQAMQQFSRQLNGSYYLNFHMSTFGNEPYNEVIHQFATTLDPTSNWITTFEKQNLWWKQKDQVLTSIILNKQNQTYLSIVNSGPKPIKNIKVLLTWSQAVLSELPTRATASVNRNKKLSKEIVLTELGPKEEIQVPLQRTTP